MSGFLGRRTRLTRGRLVGALGALGAACAVIAILAPLIGTDQGRGGWHLTFDDWHLPLRRDLFRESRRCHGA